MRIVIQAGILICFMSLTPSCEHVAAGPGMSDAAPSDADDDVEDDDDDDRDTPPSTRSPANTPQLLMADSAHMAFVRASLGR